MHHFLSFQRLARKPSLLSSVFESEVIRLNHLGGLAWSRDQSDVKRLLFAESGYFRYISEIILNNRGTRQRESNRDKV